MSAATWRPMKTSANDSWYPRPFEWKDINESKGALTYVDIAILSTPVIGNIYARKDPSNIYGLTKTYDYIKSEIAKCERMGALILAIAGIALLILFAYLFKGQKHFLITGGSLLGTGVLGTILFSYRVKKFRALGIQE